jgi:hypothetical protein
MLVETERLYGADLRGRRSEGCLGIARQCPNKGPKYDVDRSELQDSGAELATQRIDRRKVRVGTDGAGREWQ